MTGFQRRTRAAIRDLIINPVQSLWKSFNTRIDIKNTKPMKKAIQLSIANPCSEKWENFKVTATGGYCGSCFRNVVDFSTMSDEEVRAYFENGPSHVCGRFRADQLKPYTQINEFKPGMKLFRSGATALFLLLISKPVFAQVTTPKPATEFVQQRNSTSTPSSSTRTTITGIVKSTEDDSPLPGVNVLLKNTTTGTVTDAEGKFSLTADFSEGDVLVFSFIGLETKELTLTQATLNKSFNVGMQLDVQLTMCTLVMGEVAVDDVYEPKSGLARAWEKVKRIF